MTANPWLDIPLADYEGHMALPEIAPAQMLADELESAVHSHAPGSVAIVGCSGGNGFERLIGTSIERIVGIDVNPAYVAAAQSRFGTRLPHLALHVADIQEALPSIRTPRPRPVLRRRRRGASRCRPASHSQSCRCPKFNLPFPPVIDPEAPPIRPERHVLTNFMSPDPWHTTRLDRVANLVHAAID